MECSQGNEVIRPTVECVGDGRGNVARKILEKGLYQVRSISSWTDKRRVAKSNEEGGRTWLSGPAHPSSLLRGERWRSPLSWFQGKSTEEKPTVLPLVGDKIGGSSPCVYLNCVHFLPVEQN